MKVMRWQINIQSKRPLNLQDAQKMAKTTNVRETNTEKDEQQRLNKP